MQRYLAQEDFSPPSDALPIYRIATSAVTLTAQEARLIGWHDELRSRVEAFATEFFSLAPVVRQDRFQHLAELCRNQVTLAARLESLRPGLSLSGEPLAGGSAMVAELGEHIREGFVLRPFTRALHHQTFLAQYAAERMPALVEAAATLEGQYPSTAKLDDRFVANLRDWPRRQKIAAGLERRWRRRQRVKAISNATLTRFYVVLVIIALGVVVVSLFSSDHNRKPRPWKPPPFGAPFSSPSQSSNEQAPLP
jgi:hypothetical protein